MILKLKAVKPNPYRDFNLNPLNDAKINELVGSIQDTGFWDNIAARKNKAGEYELAYGHHRLFAAIKAGLTEADFIIKEFDEATMIRVMNNENSEAFKYTVLALLESVRAVVYALAEGRISKFKIDPSTPKDSIRFAPSFLFNSGPSEESSEGFPYTASSIAGFLKKNVSGGSGKHNKAGDSVTAAINALYLIELGQLTEATIADWSVDKLLTETRARIKAYQENVIKREQDAKKRQALREEQLKLDRRRKEEAEAARKRAAKLLEKEQQARKEKAEADAAEYAAMRKETKRKQQEREEQFKVKRAALDAKVEKIMAKTEQAKEREKELPTRYAVRAMLFKLNIITSEAFAFREEVKTLARDQAVTVNERELIRQAMIAAGDWYILQSNVFLPAQPVNPLVEARQKEEAKTARVDSLISGTMLKEALVNE